MNELPHLEAPTWIRRCEALRMLHEATGRKFTARIFSRKYAKNRIRAPAHRLIWRSDVEHFIERWRKARAVPPEEKLHSQITRTFLAGCRLEDRVRRLAKQADGGTREWLESSAGGLVWGLQALACAVQRVPRPPKPDPALVTEAVKD